jgi:hypothetical protein
MYFYGYSGQELSFYLPKCQNIILPNKISMQYVKTYRNFYTHEFDL